MALFQPCIFAFVQPFGQFFDFLQAFFQPVAALFKTYALNFIAASLYCRAALAGEALRFKFGA